MDMGYIFAGIVKNAARVMLDHSKLRSFIIFEIIANYNGSIAESQLGESTTFIVSFPIDDSGPTGALELGIHKGQGERIWR